MTPNERIANEIMGWKEVGMGYYQYSSSPLDAKFPSFDSNLNECYLMEEKIKEKGWEDRWQAKLMEVLCGEPKRDIMTGIETFKANIFKIAHASPKDRVSAAIRMLDEMRGGE